MLKEKIIFIIIIQLLLIPQFISHPKGDKLRELTLSSEHGLIELNAKMYKEYVMSHPRPYDIVILFTQKEQCNLCERVLEEFIQVSDSYRDSNGFKPDMISRKRAVFFAIMYDDKNTKRFFIDLKFNSKVNILYTTPHNLKFNEFGEAYIKYDEDYIISYKEKSKNIYALKMMEFANAKSQRKFILKKNPYDFLVYFLSFVGLIFIGIFIYKHCRYILLSPILWISCSIFVYLSCVGGVVYNLIRNVPFAEYDKNGNMVRFFNPKRKGQYAGEGILMSCLFILGGTLLYSLVWVNKIKGLILKNVLGYLILIIIVLEFHLIIYLFGFKSAGYKIQFYPPKKYIKGSFFKEQGNSF
jgi:oligosaccharyltransferase complex subunit gamma